MGELILFSIKSAHPHVSYSLPKVYQFSGRPTNYFKKLSNSVL